MPTLQAWIRRHNMHSSWVPSIYLTSLHPGLFIPLDITHLHILFSVPMCSLRIGLITSKKFQMSLQEYQRYEWLSQYRLDKSYLSYRNTCQWEVHRWIPKHRFKRIVIKFIKEFQVQKIHKKNGSMRLKKRILRRTNTWVIAKRTQVFGSWKQWR